MRKTVVVTMLLFTMVATASAQKFALIDTEYIMKNIPAYVSASDKLQKATKQYEAEVDSVTKEAQKLYEDYQAKMSTLTAAQKTAREEAIVAKEKEVAELRRTYFGPEGEMVKMQKELISPIENDIYEAVKGISQIYGYDLVVDRASAMGVIFAHPRIDISDEVLKRLGYLN